MRKQVDFLEAFFFLERTRVSSPPCLVPPAYSPRSPFSVSFLISSNLRSITGLNCLSSPLTLATPWYSSAIWCATYFAFFGDRAPPPCFAKPSATETSCCIFPTLSKYSQTGDFRPRGACCTFFVPTRGRDSMCGNRSIKPRDFKVCRGSLLIAFRCVPSPLPSRPQSFLTVSANANPGAPSNGEMDALVVFPVPVFPVRVPVSRACARPASSHRSVVNTHSPASARRFGPVRQSGSPSRSRTALSKNASLFASRANNAGCRCILRKEAT